MIENLTSLSLWGSTIVFYVALFIAIIAVFISDNEEESAPIFFTLLIFSGVNQFWGNLPIVAHLTFFNVVAYILIGLVITIIRVYVKGRTMDVELKAKFKLKDHVIRWWFFWPISTLSWIFGDLVVLLYNKVGKWFELLFTLHDPKKEIDGK